ncbi:hypothetical protein P9847_08735 [Paenibacillus chibensis]|uniref:DUF4178 domain-containing protein n=1 Tax=Paenibacillus chibensis TaxID=59846 RepID=A0ABU6PR93_9BACL|nr:hypothetical protein [Paenibacillus chibensis]
MVLAVVVLLSLPWLLIYVGLLFEANPPKPEIEHGEFPFRLIYEINGGTRVIEDTLICEYDGVGMDEGQGKYRKWKGHLKSGNEEVILLKVKDPVALGIDYKVVEQEINIQIGSPRYYMGDLKDYEKYDNSSPSAIYYEKYINDSSSHGLLNSEELYQKFNIKLISWTPSEPLVNNFQ